MDDTEETIAAAAIVHGGKGDADEPLLEFVRRMQSKGRVVRGLVPGPQSDPSDCATRTVRDLDDDTIYPIGQSLGKESKACCLDPGALLKAGIVLRRAIGSNAELVIINRFGILEADGDGFSAEMLELMSRGTPVLTVVSPPYLDAWREFTGGMAIELPPDADLMQQWFEGIRRPVQASSGRT
ncbi:DUF2478 domain-containing protein [Pusillimonas sp.]|uniref:DUF2478 domain-containing protein n=1 Tax=Pusillimonas sp. TaxID=3040095 RepID=UPI0037C91FF7